ncbi:unnamed protein product, partial [Mesorhabditis spiculigera]
MVLARIIFLAFCFVATVIPGQVAQKDTSDPLPLPDNDPFVIFRLEDYFPKPDDKKKLEVQKVEKSSETSASPEFEDFDLFLPTPGVAPKFTGGFLDGTRTDKDSKVGFDVGPITNPTAYFLEGADLGKISPQKCRLEDCEGPMVDDGSAQISGNGGQEGNEGCSQVMIPLNGCLDGKGYPVGMVCRVCCECGADFRIEMAKSRGFGMDFGAK